MSRPAAWAPGRWLRAGFDALVCAGIASVLWTPNPAYLAGRVFRGDEFFHWNHFVVAPALAWRAGLALGSDVYAQYGMGWPVVLGLLGDVVPLSHQTALELAVLYACVYYAGLYALLRSACANPLLAAAGLLLALVTSIHSPLYVDSGATVMWQWPSLSPLRSPLDVFLLLALLGHARSGRPGWALAAGALVGLALFLETDGGLLLLGTLAVYWACLSASGLRVSRPSATAGLSLAGGALVLAAGLAASSHGALFHEPAAVLEGWTGGVAASSAGSVGARPFATFLRDDGELLPWFCAALGVCLLGLGHAASRALHGRLDPIALLAGCTGVYGLGRLTLFVWRSHPIRLVLVAVPVAILVTLAVSGAWRALAERLARGGGGAWRPALRGVERWGPLVLVAGLCTGLALDPAFRRYPSLWTDAGDVRSGFYLVPERREVLGRSARDRARFRALQDTIERVRALAADGATVAVLEDSQTLIHLEAGIPPWPGDASLYWNTWTLEQQAALAAKLEAERPEVVLIRGRDPDEKRRRARQPLRSVLPRDTRQALLAVLERHYRRIGSVEGLEVWRCETCGPGARQAR